MKTDKYASKLNGTTVFMKGYSASVRMHVETPNAPILVPPANYSEPQFHKSLIMDSCKEKIIPLTSSPVNGLVKHDNATIHNNPCLGEGSVIKPVEVIATNSTFNIFSCTHVFEQLINFFSRFIWCVFVHKSICIRTLKMIRNC